MYSFFVSRLRLHSNASGPGVATPSKALSSRLQYLDWLRGLAVLLMIQVHVADSFLKESLRVSAAYRFSQWIGGWAAPLFLFMAGVSLALVFDRLRSKSA